jgi:hypothetical protein
MKNLGDVEKLHYEKLIIYILQQIVYPILKVKQLRYRPGVAQRVPGR